MLAFTFEWSPQSSDNVLNGLGLPKLTECFIWFGTLLGLRRKYGSLKLSF